MTENAARRRIQLQWIFSSPEWYLRESCFRKKERKDKDFWVSGYEFTIWCVTFDKTNKRSKKREGTQKNRSIKQSSRNPAGFFSSSLFLLRGLALGSCRLKF